MPRGDRTGPVGKGPMTGRRLGECYPKTEKTAMFTKYSYKTLAEVTKKQKELEQKLGYTPNIMKIQKRGTHEDLHYAVVEAGPALTNERGPFNFSKWKEL